MREIRRLRWLLVAMLFSVSYFGYADPGITQVKIEGKDVAASVATGNESAIDTGYYYNKSDTIILYSGFPKKHPTISNDADSMHIEIVGAGDTVFIGISGTVGSAGDTLHITSESAIKFFTTTSGTLYTSRKADIVGSSIKGEGGVYVANGVSIIARSASDSAAISAGDGGAVEIFGNVTASSSVVTGAALHGDSVVVYDSGRLTIPSTTSDPGKTIDATNYVSFEPGSTATGIDSVKVSTGDIDIRGNVSFASGTPSKGVLLTKKGNILYNSSSRATLAYASTSEGNISILSSLASIDSIRAEVGSSSDEENTGDVTINESTTVKEIYAGDLEALGNLSGLDSIVVSDSIIIHGNVTAKALKSTGFDDGDGKGKIYIGGKASITGSSAKGIRSFGPVILNQGGTIYSTDSVGLRGSSILLTGGTTQVTVSDDLLTVYADDSVAILAQAGLQTDSVRTGGGNITINSSARVTAGALLSGTADGDGDGVITVLGDLADKTNGTGIGIQSDGAILINSTTVPVAADEIRSLAGDIKILTAVNADSIVSPSGKVTITATVSKNTKNDKSPKKANEGAILAKEIDIKGGNIGLSVIANELSTSELKIASPAVLVSSKDSIVHRGEGDIYISAKINPKTAIDSIVTYNGSIKLETDATLLGLKSAGSIILPKYYGPKLDSNGEQIYENGYPVSELKTSTISVSTTLTAGKTSGDSVVNEINLTIPSVVDLTAELRSRGSLKAGPKTTSSTLKAAALDISGSTSGDFGAIVASSGNIYLSTSITGSTLSTEEKKIDIRRSVDRTDYPSGGYIIRGIGSKPTVTLLGKATDANTPVIKASELIIIESEVRTANETATQPDLSSSVNLIVRDFGVLARANGTALRAVGDTDDSKLPDIDLNASPGEIDGSVDVKLRGYPVIKDIETSYTADDITITITADSVTNLGGFPKVWFNYFTDPSGSTTEQKPSLRVTPAEAHWTEGAVPGVNDTYTVTVPLTWSNGYSTYANSYFGGTLKTVSIGTERGVSKLDIPGIPSASIARIRPNDPSTKVSQGVTDNWDNDKNGYFSDYHSNAIYSNEKIEVTFTFAKAATKNETLQFSSSFREHKADGSDVDDDDLLRELLTYDVDILPAGRNDVTVTFAFKSLSNTVLNRLAAGSNGSDYANLSANNYYLSIPNGSPIGTLGAITATVKDPTVTDKDKDKTDYTFGKATTDVVHLFNVATPSASFVPPSVGSTGSVDLGFTGGSAGLYYRIPGKPTEWHRYYATDPEDKYDPKYTISAADIEAIFAPNAVIEYKDANTGDKILTINGPSAGGGGNTDPSVSHTVTLGAVEGLSEYIVAGAGLYPTTNQTFAFDVFIPEGEANEIQLSIVNSNNIPLALDWDADIINVGDRPSRKVIIRDITTDIKVTLSFVIPTGIEKLARPSVWSSEGGVTITSSVSGIARIYSLRGSLVSEFTYGAGSTSITLPAGLYFVTLSDGSSYKVIVK